MPSKILIVDDEHLFCETMREFLVEMGYNTLFVHDGYEAIAAYKRERPDLVLLDMQMPRKNGLETLRELKAFDPKVNVIVVTGLLDPELGEQLLSEGVWDYVRKPVNIDYLELAIKTNITLHGKVDYAYSDELEIDSMPAWL